MITRREVCRCVGIAVCAMMVAAPAVADPGDEVRAAASKVWKAQQERSPRFRANWTQSRVIPKGAFDDLNFPGMITRKGPAPPADHKYTTAAMLVVAGDKFRSESMMSAWSQLQGKWVEKPVSYSYNGSAEFRVAGTAAPADKTTITVSDTSARPSRLRGVDFIPITCALRGADPADRLFDLEDFTLVRRGAAVNGRDCIELRSRNPRTKAETTVWLDPRQGYMPVRIRRTWATGSVGSDAVDAEYRHDPGRDLWLPTAWKTVILDRGGKATKTCEIADVRFEFPAEIADKEFTPDEPNRSMVYNVKQGVLESSHIVRDDGTKREITVPETVRPFQELADDRSADRTFSLRRPRDVLALAAVAVSVLCIVLLVVRARRRAASAAAKPLSPNPHDKPAL